MTTPRETTRHVERRALGEVARLEGVLARRQAKVADAEYKLAAARERAKKAKR